MTFQFWCGSRHNGIKRDSTFGLHLFSKCCPFLQKSSKRTSRCSLPETSSSSLFSSTMVSLYTVCKLGTLTEVLIAPQPLPEATGLAAVACTVSTTFGVD